MKKLSALLTVSLISLNVFATPIPQEKLNSYKKAASIAISKASKNVWCRTIGGNDPGSDVMSYITFVDFATSADVNSNCGQPLLTFSGSRRPGYLDIMTITTSNDYRSVLSVELTLHSEQEVNVGDLSNPNIVKQYVLTDRIVCKAP